MSDVQLLVFAVIAVGFLVTLIAAVGLAYVLLRDLQDRASRASESPHSQPHTPMLASPYSDRDSLAGDTNVRALRVGSHDMPVSAWGHPEPSTPRRTAREVEAGELPHQIFTRGRMP